MKRNTGTPSAKQLQKNLEITASQAKLLKQGIDGVVRLSRDGYQVSDEAEEALEFANHAMRAGGVDSIVKKSPRGGRFPSKIVLFYVNRGSEYDDTLVFDPEMDEFMLISVSDWLDKVGVKHGLHTLSTY